MQAFTTILHWDLLARRGDFWGEYWQVGGRSVGSHEDATTPTSGWKLIHGGWHRGECHRGSQVHWLPEKNWICTLRCAVLLGFRRRVLHDIRPIATQIPLSTPATGLLLVAFEFGRGTCLAGLGDAALLCDRRASLALAISVMGMTCRMSLQQVTGRDTVSVRAWRIELGGGRATDGRANPLSQTSQTYGFSRVCDRTWRIKWSARL